MGEILLFALLLGSAGGGLWFVLAPLLQRQDLARSLVEASSPPLLANQGAHFSLEELDLDFQMGKLEDADYRTFRESLVAVTGDVVEQSATRERLELLIEAEVARRRSLLGASEPYRTAPSPRHEAGAGGARPGPEPKPTANRRALLAAGVAAGLFLAATGILVAGQLGRQTSQRPVATLEPGHYTTLAIAAGDANRLFAGSSDGLRTSADGGRSWSLTTVSGNVRAVVAQPTASAAGDVLAAGDGLLARSADGGLSWSPVSHDLPGTDIRALALDPRDPDRVYAMVDGHGLFASADGGRRWVRLADRTPAGIASLAVVSGDPLTVYVATSPGGVQVLADNGRGWAGASGFLAGALPTLQASTIVYDANSGDSYVSPDGRTFRGSLYVGTDQGLFKSIDGGGSWNRLTLRGTVAALTLTADGRTLAAIDDGGRLFRSRDRGLSWGASE